MQSYIVFIILFISCFITAQKKDPILFDGKIDSIEWKNAQKFDILYEIDPGNNAPSPFDTHIFITYSPTHLYVGIDAKADMKTLRSSIRNRDEGFQDDFVTFGVDTFGDGRYMVFLGANAEGSQLDLKLLPNGNDDDSYNVNYKSKSIKLKDGYQIELKIPFNVFQFKKNAILEWKVMGYRSTYADGKRSQNINFKQDRNNRCLICQTPETIRLENINPKKRFDLLPYFFSGISGLREDGNFSYGKVNYNLGISGLVDLSNSTSLEFTINPDFSQVEADVSQISVNNSFALFFPERRPFFNEGNDIINTQLNTAYTRFINKPIFSSKTIYQSDKQRFYWLTAYDQKSPYLIGGENNSYFGEGNESFINIFRYQKTYKQGSNLGIITTNRFFKDGGSGNVVGINGQFQFKKSYTFDFALAQSFRKEPTNDWIKEKDSIRNTSVKLDGESFQGNAFFARLRRNTKNWNSFIYYGHRTPLYQTPIGFTAQNNFYNSGAGLYYLQFYNQFIKQWEVGLRGNIGFNFDEVQKFSNLRVSNFLQLEGNIRNYTEISHNFREEFKGFVAENLTTFLTSFRINPTEIFSVSFFTSIGNSIGYNLDKIEVGREFNFNNFYNFQISKQFRISPNIRYTYLKKLNGEGFHYSGYISRININYQFNQALSFRLVGEYNLFADSFFFQPLLKWNPNPFTIFYIGGNNGYGKNTNMNIFEIENSEIYLKFQYLLPF